MEVSTMSAETDRYSVEIAPETDGSGGPPDLSPREAVGRWLNKLRASKSEATVSSYHYQLKLFVEFCESQSIASVREINGWDIESYDTHRRQQGVKIISLNKELITLRKFLEYCERVEIVDEGISEKVAPPEVPKADRVDETRLTAERAQKLLDYHESDAYGSRSHTVLTILWYTGCRASGLRGLNIENYNSEDQYLEFLHEPNRGVPLKNGIDGERAIGLPAHVCDIIDHYIEEERLDTYDEFGSRPLITTQAGRPSKSAVRAWTYRATFPCHHGPCPHGEDPAECEYRDYTHASKCPSSRSPHQIRTGSITWMLNRGVPIEVVAKNVNTSVRILKAHYDQPTLTEDLENRRRQHVDRLSFGSNGGDSA